MDYAALKTLIDSEPANAARTDSEVVDWCNTPSVVRDKAALPSTDVFTECLRENAEWAALTADDRQEVRDILTVFDDIPTAAGTPARAQLVAILGANTKAEIAGVISEDVSRAVAVGVIGKVRVGDIAFARTYGG